MEENAPLNREKRRAVASRVTSTYARNLRSQSETYRAYNERRRGGKIEIDKKGGGKRKGTCACVCRADSMLGNNPY